jgi:hypothetical protein
MGLNSAYIVQICLINNSFVGYICRLKYHKSEMMRYVQLCLLKFMHHYILSTNMVIFVFPGACNAIVSVLIVTFLCRMCILMMKLLK